MSAKRISTSQRQDRGQPDRDKREHERVPLGVPVLCQWGQLKVEGRAENVSVGGLYLVRTARTFPENVAITVEFVISGSKEAFVARVAHVVQDKFMGVEFIHPPLESKKRIEQYVATHSKQP